MADNLISMQHSSKASAGFSHGEHSIESDEDGIIKIPSQLVVHAKAHGFSTDVVVKALKPLAKSAKGVADDSSGDGSGKVVDGDDTKKPEKGAKSAKGVAE